MAKDKQRGASDFDDSDAMHAADEPTAVWDIEALRSAGLGELIEKPESVPPGPATPAAATARSSIIVDEAVQPQVVQPAPAAPTAVATRVPQGKSMGWLPLLVLAVLLGGGVFFLIRLFR